MSYSLESNNDMNVNAQMEFSFANVQGDSQINNDGNNFNMVNTPIKMNNPNGNNACTRTNFFFESISPQFQEPKGSLNFMWRPVNAQDSESNDSKLAIVDYMSISANQAYYSKSVDEVRYEDYLLKREGVIKSANIVMNDTVQAQVQSNCQIMPDFNLFNMRQGNTQAGGIVGQKQPKQKVNEFSLTGNGNKQKNQNQNQSQNNAIFFNQNKAAVGTNQGGKINNNNNNNIKNSNQFGKQNNISNTQPQNYNMLLGISNAELSKDVSNGIKDQKLFADLLEEVEEKNSDDNYSYWRRRKEQVRYSFDSECTKKIAYTQKYFGCGSRKVSWSIDDDTSDNTNLYSHLCGNSMKSYKREKLMSEMSREHAKSFSSQWTFNKNLIEISQKSKPMKRRRSGNNEENNRTVDSSIELNLFKGEVISLKILIKEEGRDSTHLELKIGLDEHTPCLKQMILNSLISNTNERYGKLTWENISLMHKHCILTNGRMLSSYNLSNWDEITATISFPEDDNETDDNLLNLNLPEEEDEIKNLHYPPKKQGNVTMDIAVPKLTKEGYQTIPDYYKEIISMPLEKLQSVEKFKIFNEHGMIEFQENVDLTGLDLDDTVTIEKNYIAIYAGKIGHLIPPRGKGLNVPAHFTMKNMHMPSHFQSESEFVAYLVNSLNQERSTLISYDRKSNELKFSKGE